jgi:hypothetical protein
MRRAINTAGLLRGGLAPRQGRKQRRIRQLLQAVSTRQIMEVAHPWLDMSKTLPDWQWRHQPRASDPEPRLLEGALETPMPTCSASLQFQDEVESALPTEQCGTARVIWLAFRGLVNMSARFLEEISEELSISSGSTVGRWRSSVEAWRSARAFG